MLGAFTMALERFFMDIVYDADKDGLELQFYGVKEEAFSLEPYQEDSFTLLASHDELVRRGRFYDYDMEYYIIQFQVSENDDSQDNVVALSWKFDSSVEGEPESLKKGG